MRLWLFGGKKATSAVPIFPDAHEAMTAATALARAAHVLVPLASRRPARGASGMSARGVAPVAPSSASLVSMTANRVATPRRLVAFAATSSGGDGGTGAQPEKNKKKRRRRRRAPKKKAADADGEGGLPARSSGARGKGDRAVFMGTIDLDDDALEDSLMRSLASRPDPNAVFRGTIDDDDLDLFATFDDIDAKAASAKAATAGTNGPTPPESGGHPDLAFLYDPAVVASIAGDDGDGGDGGAVFMGTIDVDDGTPTTTRRPAGVNAPEIVGRCNEVVRRCDSMDAVLSAVREMTAAGIEPTESTYVAVMLACRNNPSVGPGRAMDVYDAAAANGVNVSLRTYDLAMECAVRAKRVADALRVKEDMERSGHNITPRTYAVLLNLLANTDVGKRRGPKPRLVRTCKLFEEMLGKNVAPPPAAFNSLIVAAKRAKQPDLVARSFAEMVNAGVDPSRETYETTLAAVSAGGMADAALEVFAKMRSDGFKPRKSTYNSLLEACATAPQPRAEQAFEIYHVMVADGAIAPNKRTFVLLIDAATRAGKPELAFDAFDAMKKSSGLSMSSATSSATSSDADDVVGLDVYNRLIHACAAKGPDGLRRALDLFHEVKTTNSLTPDAYTYGSVLGACAAAGDAKTADALVAEMSDNRVSHNRVTRHAYITALGRAGRWEDALDQFETLRGAGIRGGSGEFYERSRPFRSSSSEDVGACRESFSLTFDALLGGAGAEAAIASCALEPGGGDAFMRSERAASARAVFREGVDAGVYEDPVFGLDTSLDVSVDLGLADFLEEGEGAGKATASAGEISGRTSRPPLRVSFTSMTRSESIVATMVLLESFASSASSASSAPLPSGLFIGAGPGTRGNAQRRMLAVESVLRAASLRCETIEDPRTYVIGVSRSDLAEWVKRHVGAFDENRARIDARVDA